MRGYDAWKTTPPAYGPDIEWDPDFLEDSNERHACEDCGCFLSRTPDVDYGEVDGDSVTFDFTCTGCAYVHTVTSYPLCLSPD